MRWHYKDSRPRARSLCRILHLTLLPLRISINIEPTLDSYSIFSVHINDERDGDKMEKRKIEMYIGR